MAEKQPQSDKQQDQQQAEGSERSVKGKKVAILATDGFEQVELTEPRKALDAAGAQTSVVSPKRDKIRGWNFTDWGEEVKVDVPLDQANPEDFDALLLPGGVINPDTLRMNDKAVEFATAFFEAGKPVASICHGPWMVIETGAAEKCLDIPAAGIHDHHLDRYVLAEHRSYCCDQLGGRPETNHHDCEFRPPGHQALCSWTRGMENRRRAAPAGEERAQRGERGGPFEIDANQLHRRAPGG